MPFVTCDGQGPWMQPTPFSPCGILAPFLIQCATKAIQAGGELAWRTTFRSLSLVLRVSDSAKIIVGAIKNEQRWSSTPPPWRATPPPWRSSFWTPTEDLFCSARCNSGAVQATKRAPVPGQEQTVYRLSTPYFCHRPGLGSDAFVFCPHLPEDLS